jgi:hypothetical protein
MHPKSAIKILFSFLISPISISYPWSFTAPPPINEMDKQGLKRNVFLVSVFVMLCLLYCITSFSNYTNSLSLLDKKLFRNSHSLFAQIVLSSSSGLGSTVRPAANLTTLIMWNSSQSWTKLSNSLSKFVTRESIGCCKYSNSQSLKFVNRFINLLIILFPFSIWLLTTFFKMAPDAAASPSDPSARIWCLRKTVKNSVRIFSRNFNPETPE